MEKVNIIYDGPGIVQQDYSPQDDRLITSNYITAEFGDSSDYIEFFVYDQNGNLEFVNYQLEDYYPDSKNTINGNRYSALVLDPQKDLTTLGFEELPIKDKLKLYQDMLGYNKSVTDMVLEILKTKTILTEKEIVFLNLFNKLPDKSQKSLLLKLEDKVNGK